LWFLYSDLDVYSKHVLNKDILYMGIYIVNKAFFFYSNEVGGALRGTRQGSVLECL
jgi:hypothetical protein